MLLPLHIESFRNCTYKINSFNDFNSNVFLQMIEQCATDESLNHFSTNDSKEYTAYKNS